jgi:hypothetical protein
MSWRARPGRAPYQVPTGPVLSRRAVLNGLRVLRAEVALKCRHHQPAGRHPALARVRLGAPPKIEIFRPDIDRLLFPSLVTHLRDDEVYTDLYRSVEMRYGLGLVLGSWCCVARMPCHRAGQPPPWVEANGPGLMTRAVPAFRPRNGVYRMCTGRTGRAARRSWLKL